MTALNQLTTRYSDSSTALPYSVADLTGVVYLIVYNLTNLQS